MSLISNTAYCTTDACLRDVEVSKRRQFEAAWALKRRDQNLKTGGLRAGAPFATPAPTRDAPYGNTPCDKRSLVP
jgi:hypothetical protein